MERRVKFLECLGVRHDFPPGNGHEPTGRVRLGDKPLQLTVSRLVKLGFLFGVHFTPDQSRSGIIPPLDVSPDGRETQSLLGQYGGQNKKLPGANNPTESDQGEAMDYLWFAGLAVVLRPLGRTQRNAGSLHGGRYAGSGDAGVGGGFF